MRDICTSHNNSREMRSGWRIINEAFFIINFQFLFKILAFNDKIQLPIFISSDSSFIRHLSLRINSYISSFYKPIFLRSNFLELYRLYDDEIVELMSNKNTIILYNDYWLIIACYSSRELQHQGALISFQKRNHF